MKTFEERYTAWIDGQLQGDALTAFEQELARRAEAGDAEAAETDRAQALGLRALLKEHLQAPALTNGLGGALQPAPPADVGGEIAE